MFSINTQKPSKEFIECWNAAGHHLQTQVQGFLSWIKADLIPPQIEHLSFRMGNQLFFIRVEDVNNHIHGPGNLDGLIDLAKKCNGIPCLLVMKKGFRGNWKADNPGWGLTHASTHEVIVPPELVTDEKIEMTDWELQDFAVQVVRDHLRQQGKQIMSFCGNPHVSPSLWFIENEKPAWVIVKVARHPSALPALPADAGKIAAQCSSLGNIGYFAPLVVASGEDSQTATPLLRGHEMLVKYEGLKSLAALQLT